MKELGHDGTLGGTVNLIRERIKEYDIDTSHFRRSDTKNHGMRQTPETVLILKESGRRIPATTLRRMLFKSGVKHVCVECGIGPIWAGKKLTLQIDHENGNWRDNRIWNLRFLCPNCHSQTESFGAVKDRTALKTSILSIQKLVNCTKCGKEISYPSTRSRGTPKWCSDECRLFDQKMAVKANWPEDSVMAVLVWEKPILSIAKSLGVSDTAVLKRCRKRGIKTPSVGHWTKVLFQGRQTGEPAVC